ncbi:MAG: UDP-N-acetylmuramate dehydrogenase [Firmicutes bacterium]|nr:UDP-N-acetylmuramate dehydrogenase [Bacillota bacterium]
MNGISTKLSEKMPVKLNEPLSRHTTFKIGGAADIFAMPRTAEELVFAIKTCKESGTEFYIIGNGSNLLVRDRGFRGVIIRPDLKELSIDGTKITAGAGVMLGAAARLAAENSLTGMEFASGIPGTIGGGVCMNAGAYGGELKDIIEYVKILDKDLNIQTLSCEEAAFGYRTSGIMKTGAIVLETAFVLEKGNKSEILEKMNTLNSQRREKQPLEYPSAGSTFKRPEGYFAGKLIDDCGLRGFAVGDAQVSEKHCGFVVNKGKATAKDVLDLMEQVTQKVYDKFGVKLEPEVRIIGEE